MWFETKHQQDLKLKAKSALFIPDYVGDAQAIKAFDWLKRKHPFMVFPLKMA